MLLNKDQSNEITGWKTDLVLGITTIFQVCKVKYIIL